MITHARLSRMPSPIANGDWCGIPPQQSSHRAAHLIAPTSIALIASIMRQPIKTLPIQKQAGDTRESIACFT